MLLVFVATLVVITRSDITRTQEKRLDQFNANNSPNVKVHSDIGWGRDAKVDEFPFVVLIKRVDGTRWCTGTLIKPKYILTSESCVVTYLRGMDFEPKMRVFAGNVTRGLGTMRVVKKITTADGYYRRFKPLPEFNAAVLELFVPFPLSSSIQTVRYVTRDHKMPVNGIVGTMIGWGVDLLGESPPKLKTAKTRFFSGKYADNHGFLGSFYHSYSKKPTTLQLFGFFSPGVNSAENTGTLFEGDYGAPLVAKENNEFIQWGVGSFGGISDNGMKYLHVFEDVRQHLSTFVSKIVKESPVLYTDVTFVSPGSSITVTHNKLTGRTDTAWIGLIPASVTSKLEGPNDDSHTSFCTQYIRTPTGSCSLNVPSGTLEGQYKVRAFSSDNRDGIQIGNEVSITVTKNVLNRKNYQVSSGGGRFLGVTGRYGWKLSNIPVTQFLLIFLLAPLVFLRMHRKKCENKVRNDTIHVGPESV